MDKKAKDIMTKKVFTVEEGTPVDKISRIFLEKPFRHIPVVKGKKIVGIIARKDMIDKLMKQYY